MTEPEDLLMAMVGDATAYARPLVSGYAELNRRVEGKLERPVGRRAFSRATGLWTDPQRTPLYTGPARIWPVSSTRSLGSDEGPESVASTKVSINALPEGVQPRLDDVFTVDEEDPTALELQIAGAVFLVTGVTTGGQFGYGWHLDLTGITASPNDPS